MNRIVACLFAVFVTATAAWSEDLATARKAYDKADAELNKVWAQLKSKLESAEFAKVKESQRNWISYRDYVADRQMANAGGEDPNEAARLKDAGYLETAGGMTEARVAFLKTYLARPAETKAGIWTDSFGGRVEIVEHKGQLIFHIVCVRGLTFHVGDLAGVAQTNGELARYTDAKVNAEKVGEFGETWLNFEFSYEGTLKIAGANTLHYHGARAYFDGSYRRTGTLDQKAQARVIKDANDFHKVEGEDDGGGS